MVGIYILAASHHWTYVLSLNDTLGGPSTITLTLSIVRVLLSLLLRLLLLQLLSLASACEPPNADSLERRCDPREAVRQRELPVEGPQAVGVRLG